MKTPVSAARAAATQAARRPNQSRAVTKTQATAPVPSAIWTRRTQVNESEIPSVTARK